MKIAPRHLFIALGVLVLFVLFSWGYTSLILANASRKGVYPSAEQGMLSLMDKYYSADRQVKILYAGTNSFDGSKPHIWYVIAEVHASSRADGSSLNRNGCDAPGSFFLQTREGWVFIKEQELPGFVGFWMKVFNLAGEGQSAPSTNWAPNQNPQFCR